MNRKAILVTMLMMLLFIVTCYATLASAAEQNYALYFDGVEDYVEIPDGDSLSGGVNKSITVEAWIKVFDLSHVSPIVTKYVDVVWKDWGYSLDVNGSIHVMTETPAYEFEYWAGYVFLGVWTHVAFTFDNPNDTVRVYVNGNKVGETALERDMPDTDHGVQIGWNTYTVQHFCGEIEEVRVWNVSRTQEAIRNSMNRTLIGSEFGLMGYWRFDEGTGQSVHDLTENHNDGRLGSTFGSDSTDPSWVVSDLPISYLIGDVNGDGSVDVFDLSMVGQAYGSFSWMPEYNPYADITEDGLVDARDLAVVATHYGESEL